MTSNHYVLSAFICVHRRPKLCPLNPAARWRLRGAWRYQTAMLDVEMDAQAPDFEKRFDKYDEDMRGASAFTNLSDNSKALRAAFHFDIHLSRTYRRTLEQLRRLRQSENEPTEPPKTGLNGEKPPLNGAA